MRGQCSTTPRLLGRKGWLAGDELSTRLFVQVLQLVEQDVDISSVVNESMRMNLYQQHVVDTLSSGVGTVDAAKLLFGLPSELKLNAKAAQTMAVSLAKRKARSTLVQAFAFYRTKDYQQVVKYLSNLMACARLSDTVATEVKWDSKQELLDVYSLFCTSSKDSEVRDEMGRVLGIETADQLAMQQAVDSGEFGSSAKASVGSGDKEPESFF
jgi:hypothetical protein